MMVANGTQWPTMTPYRVDERLEGETATVDLAATASVRAVPSTSLIISSRDRPEFLERVIESILAGSACPDELIAIDQSRSANARLEALAAASPDRIHYRWTQERGLSRGRNAGIALAHWEWLVFVDDDVVVPGDWFERIVRAAVDAGPRTVITGRVVAGDEERPGAFAPSLSLSETAVVHRGRPGRDVLMPLNMAMHRQALADVGGFDVRLGAGAHFPSSEDNDLGFRLLEAGYAIVHDPSIVVVHRSWRAPGALLPLRWSYGRGQGAYFAKHASLRDRYMLRRLWADLWRHVRRAPRRALVHPRDGAADLVYSAALLAGAAEWLVTRPRP
jgi:GT2 family glycosyltransferase